MRKVLVATLAVLVVLGLGALAGWYWGRPAGGDRTTVAGPSGAPPVPPTSTPAAAPEPAPAQPAAAPPGIPPAAPQPKDMAFASLAYDYAKDVPEACVRFTLPLDPNGATTYRDFLALRPSPQISIRVADNALCLAGFDYGRDYTLTIRQGLAAADGTKIAEDENVTLSLAEKEPYVGIVGTGFILPREGAAGVPVETINVDKVTVHVLRVSDRNLAREARTLLGNSLNSSWALKRFAGESATLIWKGEMAVERKPNQRVVTAFPLATALKERKPGAYLVVVSHDAKLDLGGRRQPKLVTVDDDYEYYDDGEDYDYAAERRAKIAARMVVETDIALTTFSGRDGLHAFARSLETGKPAAGVELALVSTANEELARPVTDAAGHVQFATGLMRGLGGAAPAALMAFTKAGDFALLDLRRPAFDLSDRGVSGRPAPGPIDAFLYADRGIYRPGETVNLMALIRDQQVQGASGLPITLAVARPNGVELRRFVLQPDAAGGIPLSFALPDTAPRGMWSVTAFVDPKGAAVGRIEFDVQDFVPQRLKVAASLAAKSLAPGDAVELAADAMFLYGAPAAELTTEAEIRLLPDRDPFPEQKGWKFGRDDDPFVEEVIALDVEATDQQGHAVARGKLKRLDQVSVPLKAQASISVFEPSGRFVQDRVTVPFRNRDVLLGIRPAFADGRVAESSVANFELAAFDAAGERIARRDLRVRFYYEWTEYTWFSEQGRWSYKTTNRPRLLEERTVNIAADQTLAIGRGVDWGRYRIVVEDLASGAASSYRYRGGWAPTTDAADVPDKIAVLAEKPVYGAGETAKLRLIPPMAGEALVVVATDKVWETRTISVPAEGTDIEVPVKAEWGPGAYVMATWYRPLAAGRQRDPVRAVGLAWVAVDAAPRTLAVAIQAPEKVKPQTTLEVPIEVKGATGEQVTVTLAAVDEGILQLTRFATPDPVKHYFGKRRLAVDLRDDYGRLLDPKAGLPGQLREGGDGIGGAGLPVVPTKSVSLFSGPVAVDAQGRATIKVEVPDFVGQLRLMAVAYGRTKVGNGEGKVIVRHPLVADASFPRFLAPHDVSQMMLLVHNVEGAAGTYRLNVAATGAVRVPQNPGDRMLGVNERKLEALPLEAVAAGIGTVTLDVSGPDGLAFKREWQIAVRSPHLPITLEQVAGQADGATFTVDPNILAPFEPGTGKVAINYSAIRGIDVGGLLQSLERYPYGCTEQQVSRAYPLVSAKDLGAVSRALNGRDEKLIRQNAQASVDIVLDRQDETGAIGLYRAGDGAAWPWVQVQAVEFLIRAKEAGYAVPDRAVALGYAYLENIAKGTGGDYRYNREADQAASALAERAYAMSVLARAGRGDIGAARQLHDRGLGAMRGALGPALLGAALADMGDKGRSVSAFRYALTQVGQAQGLYDYYGSALRDVAGALALAVETGQAAEREALFAELAKRQKTPERATTQEKLWLSRAALSMLREGELSLAAGGVQPVSARGVLSFTPTEQEIAQGYSVTNRSGREAYRALIVQGAPREAPPALNAGFEVSKSYFTMTGEKLDPAEVKQHDRILVSIKAKAGKGDYRQAVLVDPLPAGWEIEAVVQRYEEDKSPFPWLEEVSAARVREVRDDRFVAAVDLGNPPRRFWYDEGNSDGLHVAYVVRAVTPGAYVLPATVVEDMYQPGYMGRTATGRTRVGAR